MCFRYFLERRGAEYFFHLSFKRFREQAVDIVVAVINKQKAPLVDVFLEILSFVGRELDELVAAEVAERATEEGLTTERHNVFLGVHRQRGVFNERV